MAKAVTNIDPELIKTARSEARELLKAVFDEAQKRSAAPTPEGLPPLFKNGIELIRVKFEVALTETAKFGVEFEVAGPKPLEPPRPVQG
jgi:hypothetical protein